MRNSIFDSLQHQFSATVGGSENLESGRGTRFRSPSFSRFTIYHGNVAAGNNAEVAFHLQSLAQSTGFSEVETRLTLDRLRAMTGREINFNMQQRWPRVGVRTASDAALIMAFVESMFVIARARRNAGDV